MISHALRLTSQQASSDDLDEEACEALKPVLQDCHVELSRLKVVLEKATVAPVGSEWKRNIKALATCFHDKEIASIESSLSRSLTVINHYHGAYTATTAGAILKQLTVAIASIPDRSDTPSHATVRHFMVPSIWSDDFSGRQEIMTRLEEAFSQDVKHTRVAVVGLGGVGKTRIMIEYAYK